MWSQSYWFVGGIFGQVTPNLNDPYIYSATILYDSGRRVIPYQINNKIQTPSDFFENWHTCLVHRETTSDQNLAYFDFSPLRYNQSIFEAIIYTSSFKQPLWMCPM